MCEYLPQDLSHPRHHRNDESVTHTEISEFLRHPRICPMILEALDTFGLHRSEEPHLSGLRILDDMGAAIQGRL